MWKEIYICDDGSITKQTVSSLGIKIRTSEDRSILKKPRVAQKDDYACEKRYTVFSSDFFSFIIRYEFQSFCDASVERDLYLRRWKHNQTDSYLLGNKNKNF